MQSTQASTKNRVGSTASLAVEVEKLRDEAVIRSEVFEITTKRAQSPGCCGSKSKSPSRIVRETDPIRKHSQIMESQTDLQKSTNESRTAVENSESYIHQEKHLNPRSDRAEGGWGRRTISQFLNAGRASKRMGLKKSASLGKQDEGNVDEEAVEKRKVLGASVENSHEAERVARKSSGKFNEASDLQRQGDKVHEGSKTKDASCEDQHGSVLTSQVSSGEQTHGVDRKTSRDRMHHATSGERAQGNERKASHDRMHHDASDENQKVIYRKVSRERVMQVTSEEQNHGNDNMASRDRIHHDASDENKHGNVRKASRDRAAHDVPGVPVQVTEEAKNSDTDDLKHADDPKKSRDRLKRHTQYVRDMSSYRDLSPTPRPLSIGRAAGTVFKYVPYDHERQEDLVFGKDQPGRETSSYRGRCDIRQSLRNFLQEFTNKKNNDNRRYVKSHGARDLAHQRAADRSAFEHQSYESTRDNDAETFCFNRFGFDKFGYDPFGFNKYGEDRFGNTRVSTHDHRTVY